MECERATVLLSGMIDSALGSVARFRVHRHVAGCNACIAKLEDLGAMQAAIRTKLPCHRVPPGLAARAGVILPHDEPPRPVRPWFRAPAFSLPGTGLMGALAGVALTMLVMGGQSDPTMSVIDSHLRSLQADHLTDVLTSDQHTVKPWLSARLGVSPTVLELKDAGFPLTGGRQDYVDGHPAAVVVYRHAKHVINLFAWASSGQDEAFRDVSQQGFNIVTWRHDGMAYYAVSDVEIDQLAQFAKLVAQG
jgi:anti-sigma factor RsiW